MRIKIMTSLLGILMSSACFGTNYDLVFVEKDINFQPQQVKDVVLECPPGTQLMGMLPSMKPNSTTSTDGFSISIHDISKTNTKLTLHGVQHLGGISTPRRPDGILTVRIMCYK